jgi:hypothetical protein
MPKYFLDLTLKQIEDIYGFQKMKFAQNMPEELYLYHRRRLNSG